MLTEEQWQALEQVVHLLLRVHFGKGRGNCEALARQRGITLEQQATEVILRWVRARVEQGSGKGCCPGQAGDQG